MKNFNYYFLLDQSTTTTCSTNFTYKMLWRLCETTTSITFWGNLIKLCFSIKKCNECLFQIECLFFVLTCIGKDLEAQLPQQLEGLLTAVRDGFLNSQNAPPAIRRTLLQLIELQASRWQLPGNTVLYYYPSSK